MADRMLSCKGVMELMSVSKSKAYEIMWAIPHMESPVRVWERDLREYIESRMVYPIQTRKRRTAQ